MIDTDKLHDALREMGEKYIKKTYRDRWSPARPTTGFCYIVAEVYYHFCAPEGSKPHLIRMNDRETHWFIKHPDGVIVDLTADQFDMPVPYEKGKPRAFMTKNISKRAHVLASLLGLA